MSFRLVLLTVLLAGPAGAATVHVANHGVNSPTCGSAAAPCRSITQGIAVAVAGDTVLVGPGRYGDLNGTGVLGGPGEEVANVGGCACMVNVSKAVRVLSSAGADATVIDMSGVSLARIVVITSGGAKLGARSKGFTITGAPDFPDEGVAIVTRDGAVVEGNHIVGNYEGLYVGGVNDVVRFNRIVRNAVGIFLGGTHTFLGSNYVTDNEDALELQYDPEPEGTSIHEIRGNYFVANGGGLLMNGYHDVVTGNAFIGNRGGAIGLAGSGSFCKNNFYGNDEAPNGSTPCSATNVAFYNFGTPTTMVGNFWGAASGPGPNPADAICDDGGTTTTVDNAVKPNPVKASRVACP